ncbi:UDP-glucose dehydrogenase family protein [Tepidibacter hydrothermalis]|uniref:UDP-glucose 6-dehydrogenase n=1 Tax=Tepidibacter hydrothermalis TaxID=3036126 RepID=A0ABY8EEK6_9FIRM|nr:UDP-glucose/GDP-mannose dehydrogenase family protein [Tepidibacter hydrothermalis]WFD11377.1 UDP-glucose/GDP-mannose dehydrogenase family protein [Tepidibacter hydrothermalis]
MNICVIGAGYVGLITSVAFAKMGNDVICVEKDINKVDSLNNSVPTIYEEGLNDLLIECIEKESISFTNKLEDSVKKSDIVFIAVGTPSLDNGEVDMSQVHKCINEISKSINRYTIIVNKSTVPVGSQKYVKDILIKNGVPCDKFDVVSNPEFLREGKALYDVFYGDKIVIGCESQKSRNIMNLLYKPFNIPIIFTNPETAEIIKYTSNAFLSTKISFINEVANLCNKVGADVDTVALALGLDKRISPEFLKPGIGYGGSCFPKDTLGLISIGKKYDCPFEIVKSAVSVNNKQRVIPVDILLNEYNDIKDKTITLLGLTFKSGTDDIRESPSLYIIEELLKRGAKINAYDPMVSDEIKEIYPNINYFGSMNGSILGSECIIICTDWEEFKGLDLDFVKDNTKEAFIIDGRNMLSLDEAKKRNIKYYSIGKGYTN